MAIRTVEAMHRSSKLTLFRFSVTIVSLNDPTPADLFPVCMHRLTMPHHGFAVVPQPPDSEAETPLDLDPGQLLR